MMAHVAVNETLLKDLAYAISPRHVAEYDEQWLRATAQAVSGRLSAQTNQFEVYGRLRGLVEKLRILNRDDRAESLATCTDEIEEKDWRCTPEVLALLLSLANRPSRQPISLDLTELKEDASTSSLSDSRSDVDQVDDGGAAYDDTMLWRDVDFAANETDSDEDAVSILSETSSDDQDLESLPTEHVDFPDHLIASPSPLPDASKSLIKTYWQRSLDGETEDQQPTLSFTELEASRECIHMLLGLPTSIFTLQPGGNIEVREIKLTCDSRTIVRTLLADFAVTGEQIQLIRLFSGMDHSNPLIQRFQSCLLKVLLTLDGALNMMQSKILDEKQTDVVSLIALFADTDTVTNHACQLYPLLSKLNAVEPSIRPFRILEGLFDLACARQAYGDTEGYEYWAETFFECFELYEKSLSLWMEEGELAKNDQNLFIRKNNGHTTSDALWQDGFSIVKTSAEGLFAPNFLHLAATKILNSGKSVFMLKLLDVSVEKDQHARSLMSFSKLCNDSDPLMLIPFSELFNASMNKWIASKHLLSTNLLRQQLERQCRFSESLDALEYLFLAKDGFLAESILLPLYTRMDENMDWNDIYILTDLLQRVYSVKDCIDVQCISVCVGDRSSPLESRKRSMEAWDEINISYKLPWVVANIIKPASQRIYQRIFTSIAQLRRAAFLLHKGATARSIGQTGGRLPKAASRLRYRLLHFVNALLSHILLGVIDVRTSTMRRQMVEAPDLDGMIAVHEQYMVILEDQCLLSRNHKSVKQAIISVLNLTSHFSDCMVGLLNPGLEEKATNINEKQRSPSFSSDEESDREEATKQLDSNEQPGIYLPTGSTKKLRKIEGTFTQLLGFITVTVQGLSKSDGATCWQILASHLAAGQSPRTAG